MRVSVNLAEMIQIQSFLLAQEKIWSIQVPLIPILDVLIKGFHCDKWRIEFKLDELWGVTFTLCLNIYLRLKFRLIYMVH